MQGPCWQLPSWLRKTFRSTVGVAKFVPQKYEPGVQLSVCIKGNYRWNSLSTGALSRTSTQQLPQSWRRSNRLWRFKSIEWCPQSANKIYKGGSMPDTAHERIMYFSCHLHTFWSIKDVLILFLNHILSYNLLSLLSSKFLRGASQIFARPHVNSCS